MSGGLLVTETGQRGGREEQKGSEGEGKEGEGKGKGRGEVGGEGEERWEGREKWRGEDGEQRGKEGGEYHDNREHG